MWPPSKLFCQIWINSNYMIVTGKIVSWCNASIRKRTPFFCREGPVKIYIKNDLVGEITVRIGECNEKNSELWGTEKKRTGPYQLKEYVVKRWLRIPSSMKAVFSNKTVLDWYDQYWSLSLVDIHINRINSEQFYFVTPLIPSLKIIKKKTENINLTILQ